MGIPSAPRPWERAAAITQPPAASPPPIEAAVVTPAAGPPSQEPPKPIVVQNAAIGLGATALTNVMSSGLTGDPEMFKFAAVCNVGAQIIKHHPKFNEKLWTLPFMAVVGVFFCCWYFRDPLHWDLLHFWMPGYHDWSPKGFADGITAALQASINYQGLQATGVSPMKPVAFENSVEGQKAAVAATP